jgi:hypothetical protein
MMAMTRAAADKIAFDHVISVLTSTLSTGSKKPNPYYLVCRHIPMSKTAHFDMLDEFVLDGEIPMLDLNDDTKHQQDSNGNVLTFILTKIEIKRLLALSMYWDNVIYNTPGGKPSVAEWHNLDEVSLGATICNINASKLRLAPHPPPPTALMIATAAAALASKTTSTVSASSNFEKGTRRSVADYKVFRDRKTWNQFQRGLLATAHMHGVGDILDTTLSIPTIAADLDLYGKCKKASCSVSSLRFLLNQPLPRSSVDTRNMVQVNLASPT